MTDWKEINEPRLTVIEWVRALQDSDTISRPCALDIFRYIYTLPNGTVTGKELSEHFKVDVAFINSRIVLFGKRAVQYLNLPDQKNEDTKDNRYWNIPFTTSVMGQTTETGNFIWILRPELIKALDALSK